MKKQEAIQIPEPPFSRFFFADTHMAFFWLLIRLYIGWQWLVAGYEKIINPLWFGPKAGVALQGFLLGALKKTAGAHPDVSAWYGNFISGFVIHNTAVFSYMVAFGEFFVGAALILGIFTGIAAFFGGFMNMNYLFAGTISINPLMFICEVLLILAWRVAGWYGLDRFFLPLFGTPWYQGSLFKKKK